MRVVTDRAAELTGASGAVVELVDGDAMVYRAVSGAARDTLGLRLDRATSLSGRCVAERRPLRCDDAASDPRVNYAACVRVGLASMICVPLLHHEVPIGVLKVFSSRAHGFTDEDEATLGLLADVVAAAMRGAAAYEARVHESMHDVLTGLGNRRAFDLRLGEELQRHRRYRSPLCLAMLDLDGFKGANDRFGHGAGDAALREVARLLRHELRTVDGCHRIGGDEFALLLPETDEAGARIAVARCEAAVQQARLCDGAIGISAGIAAAADEPPEALVRRADQALYVVKRAKKAPA